jgi:hypothetical protein
LVTNVVTRGYSMLLFGRMVLYIWTLPNDYVKYAREAMASTGACAIIALEGKIPNIVSPFTDLPEYTAAHVVTGTEEHRIILADKVPPGPSTLPLYVHLFSYGAHRSPAISQ